MQQRMKIIILKLQKKQSLTSIFRPLFLIQRELKSDEKAFDTNGKFWGFSAYNLIHCIACGFAPTTLNTVEPFGKQKGI